MEEPRFAPFHRGAFARNEWRGLGLGGVGRLVVVLTAAAAAAAAVSVSVDTGADLDVAEGALFNKISMAPVTSGGIPGVGGVRRDDSNSNSPLPAAWPLN